MNRLNFGIIFFQLLIIILYLICDSCVTCEWVEIPQLDRNIITTTEHSPNGLVMATSNGGQLIFAPKRIIDGSDRKFIVPKETQIKKPQLTTTVNRNVATEKSPVDVVTTNVVVELPSSSSSSLATEDTNLKKPLEVTTIQPNGDVTTLKQAPTLTTTLKPPSWNSETTTTMTPPPSPPSQATDDDEYEDDEEAIVTEEDEEEENVIDYISMRPGVSNSNVDYTVTSLLDIDDIVNGTRRRHENGSLPPWTIAGQVKIKPAVYNMGGFMPLLKTIQATLVQNKRKLTTDSKIELLESIRDRLLANINYRLDQLWGDGKENQGPRGVRNRRQLQKDGYGDHDHHHYESEEHHVDFPSNAAALLALSFLTFAVFLIKLVLQVIQALKMKSNMMMTTTTTMESIYRHQRDIWNPVEDQTEATARILNLIETYSFN